MADDNGSASVAENEQEVDRGPNADPPEPKTFSEDDVNRIVQERLARQKAQFADYGDLKEKASKFDELQQEQMSEIEKAKERAAQLERELAEANAAKQDSLLRAAVVAEAAKRNVVDPDAALALLDRSLLEFGDDDTPTNIAEAMDSLLTAKPYLVGGGATRGSADLGARGSDGQKSQIGRDALQNMAPDEIVKARREGRLDAVVKGEA